LIADSAVGSRLRELFAPASIALVGASDTSGWARNVYTSLQAGGFQGRFVPVHPRHETAFGIPTRPSLRELEEPVDLAFILAPTEAVEAVVQDAGAAGIRNAVVLAAGFAEVGEAGRALERQLVETARALGITLLGPNGLGFINATDRVAPYGLLLTPPLLSGAVGIVLQSGALANSVLTFGRNHGIGLTLLVSTGNEAMVTTADVIEHLLEDEATKVIALFLEQIREPQRFAELARRAQSAGKPMVALKVGRSPAGQLAALAHTGAVAGDDAVVDAALRQLGVIRVDSLEELLVTAGLLATSPPLRGRRLGVVTWSGGACDIIADRAHAEGLEVPALERSTTAALEKIVPAFGSARNPVDVTGFGLAHQPDGSRTPIAQALDVVSRDPNVDVVVYLGVLVPPTPDPLVEARLDDAVQLIGASPVPVVNTSTTCVDLSEYARDQLLKRGLYVAAGLDLGLRAIGHAVRWEERRARPVAERSPRTESDAPDWLKRRGRVVWAETEARRLLELSGFPLVPAELALSADEAVEAAHRIGYPVVLKACVEGLAHKSDVGGVKLGLAGDDAVREAFAGLHAIAAAALVTPMRTGGLELFAGVTRDPTFGPVLAAGLGGVWVELLDDVALRVLPVDKTEVVEMLRELRGAPRLFGARGTDAVDLDGLAEALVSLAGAALLAGPGLEALEVNPIWCGGGRIEGLDARLITAEEG